MAKVMEEQDGKKFKKFQWFLFTGLIPLLFALVVALIVFSFAGINVFDKAAEIGQKTPVLSSLFGDKDNKTTDQLETNIIKLEGEIKDREAEIEQLQAELDGKDKEMERSKLEKEQLQAQIDELMAIQEDNKRAFKDIIKMYETMSAKKAAPIITQMNDEEAAKILTNVKADTLAAIMENMSSKDAAKYTEMLTNENE